MQAWISDDAGNAATFGHWLALDLLDVGGEIDGVGTGNVAAHAEAVHWSTRLQKFANAGRGQATADDQFHMLKACQVQASARLYHQIRGDTPSLARGVETDAIKAVAQGRSS